MVKSFIHVLSASSAISILTFFPADFFLNLPISSGFMCAQDDKRDLTRCFCPNLLTMTKLFLALGMQPFFYRNSDGIPRNQRKLLLKHAYLMSAW